MALHYGVYNMASWLLDFMGLVCHYDDASYSNKLTHVTPNDLAEQLPN